MKLKSLIFVLAMALEVNSVQAQDRFADVTISETPLRGSAHMLEGAGGNIGVSAGKDGVLIIDDQFEPLAGKIASALKKLGNDSPKFIINTHFHGDHTGANAYFKEHKGSIIFAHENVRERLANDGKSGSAALPVVTFNEGLKFHFNDETLHIIHFPAAHTDGDSVVWFEEPNVIHTGDLFFNERFPFIDLKSGGTVTGYIDAVRQLLDKVNEKTIIVPGHGPLAEKADYQEFLNMIEQTRAFVQKEKEAGKSADEIVKSGLDKKWADWSWDFITEEKWIRTLYQ